MRFHPIVAAVILLAAASCTGGKTPVESVDPFIGTGFHGHTYPGATTPFGLVQLSPDTRNRTWDGSSGYHTSDSTILGFSHTHLSGTGCQDLGDFLFTPSMGDIAPLPFSHEDETASPGYYRVRFKENGITAELTATSHAGIHRYSFPIKREPRIRIDMRHTIGDCIPDSISFNTVSDRLVQGGRHISGWAPDRYMFFSASFSVPFSGCKDEGEDRYLLTFPEGTEEVTVSVGLSEVDAESAEQNRIAEVGDKDFDAVRAETRMLWANNLGKVKVEGGSSERMTIFYTALYHTMVSPNLMSDLDGRYRNHCQEIASAPQGRRFYSTLSLWDTFRSWNPLQTLINPGLVEDMVFSLLDMYDCDGVLPKWPLGTSDTGCMIGYHAIPVIADAWLRGIRGFDGERALKAMVETSNKNENSPLYNQYGYIPSNRMGESVSQTLEFAYDDWCIARMAEDLGHKDLASEYDARARRYLCLFDSSTGFMRPRNDEGNWSSPFSGIVSTRDFTEGVPWQYRFFAPHDINGLVAQLGGRDSANAALDSLFTYDERDSRTRIGDMTGLVGQYAHGNEPSHSTAYMYYWTGKPSSSQARVRQMLDEMYAATPEGICGNEDCGQMSAWYVLSALGIYPACPGTGEFLFAAPVFKKAVITLGNGKVLTITADHPEYQYISNVTFNGEPVGQHFIDYETLMKGGELNFTLSPTQDNGRDGLPAPYSLTAGDQVSVPYIKGNPCLYEGTFPVNILCRTEGATIHYTLDGSEPDENSPVFSEPFGIDKDCIISAKAFKEGLDPSPLFRIHAYPAIYRKPTVIGNPRPGCNYTYHLGNFTCTADVLASKVVSRGEMPTPSIKGAPDEDHFGYIFTGYLDIASDGIWEFFVSSDDGGVLEIDGTRVVDNDGSHSAYSATGRIPLLKGYHAFRLLYLEDYEGQSLAWGWKSPSDKRFSRIPDTAIIH